MIAKTIENKYSVTITIGRYTIYAALFVKVTWKPIPHTSKVTIDEVDTSKGVK